jgi:ATP synthase in type III secretion protein N
MKRGRVIEGDVTDARDLADAILRDARAEAEMLRTEATAEAAKIHDAGKKLAAKLVQDARAQTARAEAELAAARVASATARAGTGAKGDGVVSEVVGLVVRATVPGIELGEVVNIDRGVLAPIAAEVVGFRGDEALLLPLGELAGVAARGRVLRTGGPLAITCGDDLLGRVLDGVGQPIDDGAPLAGESWPVDRPAPSPLSRPRIAAPLATGVRAIDGMLAIGDGQRIGLFAGAGVGKSTLLGQIARGTAADVCVVCLVGERGRELGDLLGGHLAERRARTVTVCATSDAPCLVRLRAVHVATAIAEWFRDRRGARVLLVVDSLTRVARAQREVGLSVGEPAARHGYPPSVFALLPRLVERAGPAKEGSITGVYTVLVAGNDLDEPIADEVRGLVDGHVVLDRRLAGRGHFPPIDVVASVSRLMGQVTPRGQQEAAARVRRHLAVYEEHRDLITLGAYKAGSDAAVDAAIARAPAIERFLVQAADEVADWDATQAALAALAPEAPAGK